MRVSEEFSSWGVEADFAAVASHSAAIGLASFRLSWSVFVALTIRTTVVVDAVVVLAQHREIRGFRMPAVLVGVDMVDLAPISGHIAVWPWAHEVLCHGESAQLVRCEPRFVQIHRAGGGVKESDVELVTQSTFHCGVDEFDAGHGRAVG